MNFDLNEEQRLLQASVNGLIEKDYGFEKRNAYRQEECGWSRKMWLRFAEQGLLSLPFDEEDGGIGGTAVETMIVMEALGRALIVEPYLSTVVICGGFLKFGGTREQRARYLSPLMQGTETFSFAYQEKNSRYDFAAIETSARRTGEGWYIHGAKSIVLHGDTADHFIVTARTGEETGAVGIFLVPRKAAGVSISGFVTQDGVRAADVLFNHVAIGADAVIGNPDGALDLIEKIADHARMALCAEAIGAMDESIKMTVDYMKARKQFGVPIGTFQALQHRAADMYVAYEQARSMAIYAAMACEMQDSEARSIAVASAKAQIARSARFIGQQSIQIHGGIGMTQEYKVGHYFKRLTMIESAFGDADFLIRRVSRHGGVREN